MYKSYVDAGEDWTWRRLSHRHVRMVIVLGKLAEDHLFPLLKGQGCRVAVSGPHSQTGVRAFTVSFPDNRSPLICLGVTHPSWRNKYYPGYTRARLTLASMSAHARDERLPILMSSEHSPVGI